MINRQIFDASSILILPFGVNSRLVGLSQLYFRNPTPPSKTPL